MGQAAQGRPATYFCMAFRAQARARRWVSVAKQDYAPPEVSDQHGLVRSPLTAGSVENPSSYDAVITMAQWQRCSRVNLRRPAVARRPALPASWRSSAFRIQTAFRQPDQLRLRLTLPESERPKDDVAAPLGVTSALRRHLKRKQKPTA